MPAAARFTPSLLDEDTLEALFVGRHHFIDDCVARVKKAATTTTRSAKLFVGPRGAGKTHLLSLVNYRCKRLKGFGTAFQIAWLPEDLWTIDSLDAFLNEVVRSIEPSDGVLGDSASSPAAEQLAKLVSSRGPVVVLVENLDQVLDGLGDSGQRKLRALIENSGNLLLIATTTRSGESLTNQGQPFYGFFDTTELEQFSVDDAAAMLKKIAERNGDSELSAFLDTPRGRQRLAAVAHLAGGQPRVWSLLAAGLTIEGLDDLVGVLMERFDDLTPYYQEQMGRLSMNERKTIRALADLDRSCTVKDLAAATGIEQKSIAKTISDLRRRGWVRQRTGPIVAMADARSSYYDLAEPLARLAFQLKESRGKPIRLIVEFLKLWFDDGDLVTAPSLGALASTYVSMAQQQQSKDFSSLIAKLLIEFEPFAPEQVLRVPNDDDLGPLLLQLDDALADLTLGDPAKFLSMPAGLVGPIEEELGKNGSIEAQRIRVAHLAAEFCPGHAWIRSVESYYPGLGGAERMNADFVLTLLYSAVGGEGMAELSLHSFSTYAAPDKMFAIVRRLLAPESASLALKAANLVNPGTGFPFDELEKQTLRMVLTVIEDKAGEDEEWIAKVGVVAVQVEEEVARVEKWRLDHSDSKVTTPESLKLVEDRIQLGSALTRLWAGRAARVQAEASAGVK